jgi:hypothetical protein
LTLGDGTLLEVFPAVSEEGAELWRLLAPDGSDLVMTVAGLERLPAPA